MTATVILIALGIVLTALFMLRKVRKEVLVRRNTEAMLNSLLENLPAAVCLFDSSCRCRKLNAMCASIFGFTEQTALDGVPGTDFPVASGVLSEKVLRDVLESGEPRMFPHSRTDADGKTAYYQTTLVPLRKEDEKTDAVLCLSADMTTQKLLEKAFRAACLCPKAVEDQPNRRAYRGGRFHPVQQPPCSGTDGSPRGNGCGPRLSPVARSRRHAPHA